MQYIIQTIRDIFSMGFDIILPVSGCILALAVSFVLFWIRFSSFRRNKKRYERRLRQEGPAPVPARQLPALVPPAADSAPFWGGNLVPELPLAFPSLVVASSDDPYSSLEHAHAAAARWGSRWHNLGPCGHINGDSGLGDWAEGRALLQSLLA